MKKIFALMFSVAIVWATVVPANINKAIIDDGTFKDGPHSPAVLDRAYVLIDSSGNQFGMWTNMQECIAYNPVVGGLEFLHRAFTPTGVLNVHQTDSAFSFWVHDAAVYNQQHGPARYPTSVASDDGSGNGPHISYPFLIGGAWGGIGAVYESGGWWSSTWDYPVDIGPSNINTHKNNGKQLPNGDILFIAVTATDDIIYRTVSPDLGNVIATGTVASPFFYWGFDINGGTAYVFYYDANLNIYYKTTTDGVTWSAQQTYNMVWPSPYTANIIGWTQCAVTDAGNPLLVFDNWDGNDGTYPFYSKVYVSYQSGVACVKVSSEFGAPDTECYYPTIAAEGSYATVIFGVPRNNLEDTLAWWDIYAAGSTNNGQTWLPPRKLTGAITAFNPTMWQIAKRVEPTTKKLYYCFSSSIPNPSVDLHWLVYNYNAAEQARLYVAWDDIIGIEENSSSRPNRLSLNIAPNPISRRSNISYALPSADRVSLKLYSVDGRLVRTIENGYKDAGVYTVNINGHELANGTYLLILEAGNKTLSGSLVIVH